VKIRDAALMLKEGREKGGNDNPVWRWECGERSRMDGWTGGMGAGGEKRGKGRKWGKRKEEEKMKCRQNEK
jgi:hypothetical protein